MPEGYTHPEYLPETAWRADHLNDSNMVIVDYDAEAGYNRGHIPGAVLVPDNFEKNADRVHLINADQFKAMGEGLGIGDDTLVIAYENRHSLTAARLWWVISTYGHSNVRVLNGGWRGWMTEGHATGFARPPTATGAGFTPDMNESMMVQAEEFKDACSMDSAVIWDVRSDGEWDGGASWGNKRVGHVPGAVHLEWLNLMDLETHQPPHPLRATGPRGRDGPKSGFLI